MKLSCLGVAVLLLLCPLAVFANNNSSYHGGPNLDLYYAGSARFGDSSCASCHDGGLNGSNGNVKLFFNGVAGTTYTPGATIPIKITITDTGGTRNVWGFELAARFANSKAAGTLISISSNTQVSILSAFAGSNAGKQVITHNGVVPTSGTTFTFTVNWTAPADGSGGTIYFSVSGNAANGNGGSDGDRIYTTEVALTPAASVPAPVVPSNGVVDGAGFSTKISGGGIASIFGSNLAVSTASAAALPLPTTLNGTSVSMNGIAAPLFYVSAGQINFQVPWQLLSSATSTLTVTTAGGTSPPITITLSSASPGVFTINVPTAGQGAVQLSNTTTFVAPSSSIPGSAAQPAKAGDFITIFCSGLGAVTNTPANGAGAGSGSTLSTATSSITVTLGNGTPIPAAFAGLSPGFVGLYQVNIQIPAGLGANSALPLVVTAANLPSNTATIAVQ